MSYELTVWYEQATLTADEARRKRALARYDESVISRHESVQLFWASLVKRFPPPEFPRTDDDALIWVATPAQSDRYISMVLRDSTSVAALPVIINLAREHGLVCLDPQSAVLHLPATPLRLILNGGIPVLRPEPDTVAREVEHALLDGAPAVIARGEEYYLQAGSGPNAGMQGRPGYAVEYRDGSPQAHFRYETDDLELVLAVFLAFAERDETYRTMLPWRLYPL
jgi:hypothetical protein